MTLDKNKLPPVWATRFLKWFCSDYYIDEIEGDLLEVFRYRSNKIGITKARLFYILDIIRFFFKPYVMNTDSYSSSFIGKPNFIALSKTHISSSYRSLMKNKLFTCINLLGLSIGISCTLLISLYVQDELSYDRFFKDAQNIYRISLHIETGTGNLNYAVTHPGLSTTLKHTYPEVVKSTQVHKLYFHPEITVLAGKQSFVETKLFLADNEFFDVFELEFVEGSPIDALQSRNQVVLTERIAHKYFGEDPAIGKILKLDLGKELIVSGVIKDLPTNSHFDFELLGSLEFMNYLKTALEKPNWAGMLLCTYIKIDEHSNPAELESKFPELVQSHGREQINARYGEESEYKLKMQPLQAIHLNSDLDGEMTVNSNLNFIFTLVILAITIILISCINFINLATAGAGGRAKEVGIRKVIGSSKWNLQIQFLTESVLIVLFGALIAIGLSYLILPTFNEYVNKSFTLQTIIQPSTLFLMMVGTLTLGLIAGWYPAIVLSKIKVGIVLKGQFKNSTRGVWLRNILVVFQFLTSIGLIAATIIINRQMDYVRNRSLGYDKDQVLLIKHPIAFGQSDHYEIENSDQLSLEIKKVATRKIRIFKDQLRELDGVIDVGGAFQMMGHRITATNFITDDPDVDIRAHFQKMDNDFMNVFNIEVVEGRGFSDKFNEENSILINETARNQLGWDDPIGRKISMQTGNPTQYEVIGVVKDYNFLSLHQEIGPIMLISGAHSETYLPTALAVKVKPDNLKSTIDLIEQRWDQLSPNEGMTLSVLSDDLERLYESDNASLKIIRVFALLAVALAIVGLFGLTTYTTNQRTKEIGIRKVLGANSLTIVIMLIIHFLKLVLVAFTISLPFTYLIASKWLENFAYRINIDLAPFALSLFLTILLVIITASYQSLKVALINPVRSLRAE